MPILSCAIGIHNKEQANLDKTLRAGDGLLHFTQLLAAADIPPVQTECDLAFYKPCSTQHNAGQTLKFDNEQGSMHPREACAALESKTSTPNKDWSWTGTDFSKEIA